MAFYNYVTVCLMRTVDPLLEQQLTVESSADIRLCWTLPAELTGEL